MTVPFLIPLHELCATSLLLGLNGWEVAMTVKLQVDAALRQGAHFKKTIKDLRKREFAMA
jgi:hypothetical protein